MDSNTTAASTTTMDAGATDLTVTVHHHHEDETGVAEERSESSLSSFQQETAPAPAPNPPAVLAVDDTNNNTNNTTPTTDPTAADAQPPQEQQSKQQQQPQQPWQRYYECLCAFQRERGHCRVPFRYKVNVDVVNEKSAIALGVWVKRQQTRYQQQQQQNNKYSKKKKGRPSILITQEQIALLNQIGFEWNIQTSSKDSHQVWQEKFQLLCEFQRQHGHTRVPQNLMVHSSNSSDGHPIQLGRWVNSQRQYYKNRRPGNKTTTTTGTTRNSGSISEERIAQLNSIGFEWRAHEGNLTDEEKWQYKFQLLCNYQDEHGHTRVPQNHVADSTNIPLGEWVHSQRKYYRNRRNGKTGHGASITEERIVQLNAIGFEWNAKDKTRSGTPTMGKKRPPVVDVDGTAKVKPTTTSRSSNKRQKRNHNNHKENDSSNGSTAVVCEAILRSFEKTSSRALLTDQWQQKFDLLCAYQLEHGHCRVPQRLVVDHTKLGHWVSKQRQLYHNRMKGKTGKDASIPEERIAKLNDIGFEWALTDQRSDHNLWQRKFELLCAYHREHGHCRVPPSVVVDSVRLGDWVKNQRKFYKNRREGKTGKAASITEERMAQLNSIGFESTVKIDPLFVTGSVVQPTEGDATTSLPVEVLPV